MAGRSQRIGEPWTASSPPLQLGKRRMFAVLAAAAASFASAGKVANKLTTFYLLPSLLEDSTIGPCFEASVEQRME
jgi:hypothetical protein